MVSYGFELATDFLTSYDEFLYQLLIGLFENCEYGSIAKKNFVLKQKV